MQATETVEDDLSSDAEGERPRPARRVAVVCALALVAVVAGWQLGGLIGPVRGIQAEPNPFALAQFGLTSAAAAAQAVTVSGATSSAAQPVGQFGVIQAPDAIALAIITLPTVSPGAPLHLVPGGPIFMTLPDGTIVQVLLGRERLLDDSVWIAVRAPSGETGWVAETLLRYLNQPTQIFPNGTATPTLLASEPATLTPLATGVQGPLTLGTAALASQTTQPVTAFSPTPAPTSGGRPGPASTTHSTSPTQTPAPPAQAPTPTSPAPVATVPAPTNTAPGPTHTPPPTNTAVAPTNTAPPTMNTVPPPTNTSMPTNTALPTNTMPPPTHTPVPTSPSILPTLPLPTEPLPTLPAPLSTLIPRYPTEFDNQDRQSWLGQDDSCG